MSELTKFLDESFVIKGKNKYYYIRGKYRTSRQSFQEIYNYSRKLACFLIQKGVNKGDKIIIKGPNSPQWVIAYITCIKFGFVIVPIDYKSDFDFEIKIINLVKPEFVFYSYENETFQKFTKFFSENIFYNKYINNFDNDINEKSANKFNYSDSESKSEIKNNYLKFDIRKIGILLLENLETIVKDFDFDGSFYEDYLISDDNLAEIVFTSGSTAMPKGVMLTHKNISSNLKAAKPVIERWKGVFKFMINPKLLSLVPLSHMYGQVISIFIPLMIGSSVVFLNSINPEEILKTIKKEKIWILGALPKLVSIIKNHIINKYNLNTDSFKKKYKRLRNVKWWIRFPLFSGIKIKIGWRLVAIISGGAAIDFETEDFFRCLAYSFFQGYGLTETAPLITLTDPAKNKEGSVGSFLNGQQIKIVNDEIYIKGENVTKGYYEIDTNNAGNRTSEAFKNGWFRTGDIAEIDKDGDVFIKGRVDDLIVRPDGLNIYPYDIENVIKSTSNKIKDCVVLGITRIDKLNDDEIFSQKSSQEIHAVLLLDFKNYSEISEKEINEIIRESNTKLNPYQKIDSFSIWPENDFPRTSTLKPRKNEIKKIVVERMKAQEEFGPIEGQKIEKKDFIKSGEVDLYNLINSFHKVQKDDIQDEANLQDDLGFDSLDIIELTSAIEEKFNINADSLNITKDTSLKELKNLINNPTEEIHKIPFYSFIYNIIFVILRSIFQFILFPFISILYRRKYVGRENLKHLIHPTIFISNHVSLIDTFVILYSLPIKIRLKLTTVMSIEHHFLNYFKGTGNIFRRFFEAAGFYLFICLFLNVVPLSRTHGFKQSLENIGSLIDKGWNILIFPEGAITIDGNIKEFEPGIGIIAKDIKVPIVPIRIDGLHDILHNGILPLGHFPKIPLVKINFGKQIKILEGTYKGIADKLRNIVLKL